MSPWSTGLLRQQLAQTHAFTLLAWSPDRIWFELIYTAAIVVSVLTMLGWRTRTMSVLFMIMVLSIENRDVWLGDGGDNVMQLMAVYLAFTRSGQVWSLDARRRSACERTLPAEDRTGIILWVLLGALLAGSQATGFATPGMLSFGTPTSWPPLAGWATVFWTIWLGCGVRYRAHRKSPGGNLDTFLEFSGNMLHNCAMLIIAAQVCIIYGTAGWEKIQGSLWQHGTAVYFPVHIAYFQVWPFLSNLLTASTITVFIITYGTVFIQVLFPFAILNRKAKNILLAVMFTEHLCIAVVLGLPFFSLAMLSADSVFLPTCFLLRAGNRIKTALTRSAASLRH
ncbi:HTTM domain-containing protein [Streptacidiphilus sp. 4-A2]|nr:HTTM domain-containing protein [Streptacidiphilus sp. 4-A2]